jgi:nucleotide-binding universal stress UspA family protein
MTVAHSMRCTGAARASLAGANRRRAGSGALKARERLARGLFLLPAERAEEEAMGEIQTILFASDLTPESDVAFGHARFLAERFGARLTLFHALELPADRYEDPADVQDDRRGRWGARARQELCTRARGLTVPFEIVVDEGHVGGHYLADLAVLAMIERARPDLTVMGVRSRKGFASWFVGSVTHQVVQHARRPVLCVRRSRHDGTLPYRKILVPTDLSPASRRAFPMAALMARSFEAQVAALHVAPPPPLAVLTGMPQSDAARVASEADVRRFLCPELQAVPVEAGVYVTGSPWYRIVQAAEEQRTDLIVMSTQGHDSVRDGIVGSNTDRVLRHAPCSVLVA